MNRPARQAILCVGVPGTGKTALHVRITDSMVLHPGYDSVFVLDRNSEWSTELESCEEDLEEQLDLVEHDDDRASRGASRRLSGPLITSEENYHRYCYMLARERKAKAEQLTPRRVIWRLGREPAAYGPALFEAVEQGNVVVVFSEAPDWFTSWERDWPFDQIPGREDVRLSQLYSQGRAHIPNRAGEPCKIHILTDSQDLAMVHWKVRKFSNVVLMSRIEGGESYATLKREFGDGTDELVKRVRKLQLREWIAVRGAMPELAEFRGGGRP